MANNFKSDDSFLRKLAVGAAGTNATINRLKAMGFNPIELERGSTGFKIWKKIKIKRVRVPDILCMFWEVTRSLTRQLLASVSAGAPKSP